MPAAGQFDPNNNDDPNNNPGPPYTGAADGAPGNTTIHRQAPVTYYNGTGNLTASRVWKFGAVATEGWTLGDLVCLSIPEHTGTGFNITVETIAAATLAVWGPLAANGGAFWFNGTDFQAVIPGADQGGGGSGPYWLTSQNPTGPILGGTLDASGVSIRAGGAADAAVNGAVKVRGDGGLSLSSGVAPLAPVASALLLASTQGTASLSPAGATMSGGTGGVSIGAGVAAPSTSPGELAMQASAGVEIFSPGTDISDTALSAANASSLLDLSSTTRGARPWPTMTTAQRNLIPAPATGLKVYCSDVTVGDFEYNGVGWVPYGFSQSGTGSLTAGALAVTNVYLSASSVVTISVGSPAPGAGNLTVRYDVLNASRTNGFGTGGFTISALLAAGTLNNLDTSTNVRWAISGT